MTAPHRVVAAPRPLGSAPVVVIDDAWPTACALRLALLRSAPSRVRVFSGPASPGLEAAVQEALSLVRRDAPAGLATLPAEVSNHLAELSPFERLVDLVTLAQPADLVVLRRTGQGSLVTELLAVAFPSGWSPAARLGADLSFLHGPVADNSRLQRAAPALSEALLTKGPFLQHVWGVQPDSALAHDPAEAAPVDPAGQWWLRIERQTTHPLPALDRALFWIRPMLVPLSSLRAGQRATLRASVLSMSPAALAYKGLTGDALPALLAACGHRDF